MPTLGKKPKMMTEALTAAVIGKREKRASASTNVEVTAPASANRASLVVSYVRPFTKTSAAAMYMQSVAMPGVGLTLPRNAMSDAPMILSHDRSELMKKKRMDELERALLTAFAVGETPLRTNREFKEFLTSVKKNTLSVTEPFSQGPDDESVPALVQRVLAAAAGAGVPAAFAQTSLVDAIDSIMNIEGLVPYIVTTFSETLPSRVRSMRPNKMYMRFAHIYFGSYDARTKTQAYWVHFSFKGRMIVVAEGVGVPLKKERLVQRLNGVVPLLVIYKLE